MESKNILAGYISLYRIFDTYTTWCPKFAQKNPNIKINCPYVLPLRHNQATFVLATLNFYVKGFLWKKSVILATVSSRGVIQLHTAQSYQPNKVPPQSTCLHNVGFNQKQPTEGSWAKFRRWISSLGPKWDFKYSNSLVNATFGSGKKSC